MRFVIRLIKLGISILYFAWNRVRRSLSTNKAGTCVVLYYHNVPSRYQRQFEKQMRTIADRKMAIEITRIDNLQTNEHSIVITFDDALQSFAENAVSVLVRLKIPATVFAVADALASKPVWGIGYYPPGETVMSLDQLSNLPDSIVVGSHTLTHPILTAVSQQLATQEIKLSREKLTVMLHRPIDHFSFPDGMFNDFIVHQCQEAGYQHVFTTEPVLVSAGNEQFVVGRVSVDPWDWALEFYLKISGAYCWQPYAHVFLRRIRGMFSTEKEEGSRDSADVQ